jgi:NagD protein
MVKGFSPPKNVIRRLAKIQHVALDMDGTIYKGEILFEAALPFLALLKNQGIGYTFLTNNPSKSVAGYLAHLRSMGIYATRDQLYTSTQATIDFLKKNYPKVRRLFVLGTRGLCDELKNAGFKLTPDDPQSPPDAVLVGFDLNLTYRRLCRAAWWLTKGKFFFATNPDRVCPTNEPTVLVDCGSIAAALERATGRIPDAIPGKPSPAMLQGILDKKSLAPESLAMVGDRLYTDMEMAHRTGALGVLVLTGEATAKEAGAHIPRPDLVVPTLKEFGGLLNMCRGNNPIPKSARNK